MISAALVKELREKTGVGMMACKQALEQSDGDLEKAIVYLREKGLAVAVKKADRTATEGRIFCHITSDGRRGVIFELSCETDFVSNSDAFKAFGIQLASAATDQSISNPSDVVLDGRSVESVISDLVLKLGESISLKRFEQVNSVGTLASYIHSNGKIGVLVDLSEGASSELGKDVAMQIAASNPLVVNPDQVSSDVLNQEREIVRTQALNEGKPPAVVDKIVEGRIQKYLNEICLTKQVFVKDPDKTIAQVLGTHTVTRFIRFAIG